MVQFTTERQWPYPDQGTKPYYDQIDGTFDAQDSDVGLLYDNFVYNVDTIGTQSTPGDLRSLEGSVNAIAIVKGFYAANDKGGGQFNWILGSATDDGGVIIVPDGQSTGYWKRIYGGSIRMDWYGVISNTSYIVAEAIHNTTAMQAAIDRAEIDETGLYWSPGYYHISDSLFLRKGNHHLVGYGATLEMHANVRIITNYENGDYWTKTGNDSGLSHLENLTIEGLIFTHKATAIVSGQWGIELGHWDRISIIKCRYYEIGYAALSFQKCVGVYVADNDVYKIGEIGLRFITATEARCMGNNIISCGDNAIASHTSSHIVIDGNTIDQTEIGYETDPFYYTGIDVIGSAYAIISNNIIKSFSLFGIAVGTFDADPVYFDIEQHLVIGNTIEIFNSTASPRSAIMFYKNDAFSKIPYNIKIDSNDIKGDFIYGIYANAGCEDSEIKNNKIIGLGTSSGTGIYLTISSGLYVDNVYAINNHIEECNVALYASLNQSSETDKRLTIQRNYYRNCLRTHIDTQGSVLMQGNTYHNLYDATGARNALVFILGQQSYMTDETFLDISQTSTVIWASSTFSLMYMRENKVINCGSPGVYYDLEQANSRIYYVATAGNVYHIVDTGNPNGVHTASPGSTYQNRAGGANVSLYMKETGTGNTGWVGK